MFIFVSPLSLFLFATSKSGIPETHDLSQCVQSVVSMLKVFLISWGLQAFTVGGMAKRKERERMSSWKSCEPWQKGLSDNLLSHSAHYCESFTHW